jgi:hypothetical protein
VLNSTGVAMLRAQKTETPTLAWLELLGLHVFLLPADSVVVGQWWE